MSELKAFKSERIYWAVEQVEREAGDIDNLHLDDNLFYIKSEADKVIADFEESHKMEVEQLLMEIVELKNKLQAANEQIENLFNSASSIMLSQDKVMDNKCAELRHHKYKRCLAVARRCRNESLWWYSKGYGFEKYDKFWEKWEKRWLELAEKFKEAK